MPPEELCAVLTVGDDGSLDRAGTVEAMAEPETEGRASSFGSVAEMYDRFRPGPPMTAVDWVLQSQGGIAADIGAGTGALTRQLDKRVDEVIAVEPDIRMLEVLKDRSPEISAIRGWAEELPIRSGSLGVVTISAAWHWMDADLTIGEVGRVLRSGGVLGVIGNGADRSVEWVAELLGQRNRSPGDRERRHRVELPPRSPFTGIDGTIVKWSVPMTQEQLVVSGWELQLHDHDAAGSERAGAEPHTGRRIVHSHRG